MSAETRTQCRESPECDHPATGKVRTPSGDVVSLCDDHRRMAIARGYEEVPAP